MPPFSIFVRRANVIIRLTTDNVDHKLTFGVQNCTRKQVCQRNDRFSFLFCYKINSWRTLQLLFNLTVAKNEYGPVYSRHTRATLISSFSVFVFLFLLYKLATKQYNMPSILEEKDWEWGNRISKVWQPPSLIFEIFCYPSSLMSYLWRFGNTFHKKALALHSICNVFFTLPTISCGLTEAGMVVQTSFGRTPDASTHDSGSEPNGPRMLPPTGASTPDLSPPLGAELCRRFANDVAISNLVLQFTRLSPSLRNLFRGFAQNLNCTVEKSAISECLITVFNADCRKLSSKKGEMLFRKLEAHLCHGGQSPPGLSPLSETDEC